MPKRGLPGPHQIGRRRSIKRKRTDGFWWGMGVQQEDLYSGWLFPVRLMTNVTGGGGLVSKFLKDGSIDQVKEY